jgi:hypothetical protein
LLFTATSPTLIPRTFFLPAQFTADRRVYGLFTLSSLIPPPQATSLLAHFHRLFHLHFTSKTAKTQSREVQSYSLRVFVAVNDKQLFDKNLYRRKENPAYNGRRGG